MFLSCQGQKLIHMFASLFKLPQAMLRARQPEPCFVRWQFLVWVEWVVTERQLTLDHLLVSRLGLLPVLCDFKQTDRTAVLQHAVFRP